MKSRNDIENTSSLLLVRESGGDEFSKPRSMVDQIYHSMRKAIAKGTLYPGQDLKEKELQKWFGVSRAPIREAIRLLEAERLVEVDAYKGKYVRHITRDYMMGIVPVMASLEGCAAGLATKKITNEKIDSLGQINEKMKKAYAEKKYSKCAEINFQFHKVFIQAANNEPLFRALRAMDTGTTLMWLTHYYYESHTVIPISIKDHTKILKEFVNKDIFKAEAAARNHIYNIMKRLLKVAVFDSSGHFVAWKTGKLQGFN